MKLNQIAKAVAAVFVLGNLATTASALEVGVVIEETDIADLRAALAATREWPIRKVFGNLLNGSLNHLAAFTRLLR